MADLQYDAKQIKILIVDDHDLMRKSIMKVLKKKGFQEFYDCTNGHEAISILENTNIDLIFCDLYMPKVDGFELLSFLRNRTSNHDIPFIIVTGEAGKDDIVKAIDIGAEDYLLKPYQSQELERKTHQVLSKYFKPNPLLFNIRIAERSLLEGNLEQANSSIKAAIQQNPTSARALHALAMIKYAEGEAAEALRVLNENIANNPSFLKNYITMGDIHLNLSNTSSAIDSMKHELELNPKNVRRQIQLAQLLHKSGDFIGAIEHYRQALLENPKAKQALFGMGKSHVEIDNLEKAFYYFKRMRRHYPDLSKPLEAMVKYAVEAKIPRMAELALRDEKKNYPKRLDTYIALAKLYSSQEMWEEALAVCKECLIKEPEMKEALVLQGAIEQKLKLYEESERTYRKLSEIAPGVKFALKIAESLTEQGKTPDALRLLHKWLKRPKSRPQVLQSIAIIEARSKHLTKSYFIYSRCQQLGDTGEKTILATNKLKKIIVARRFKKSKQAS